MAKDLLPFFMGPVGRNIHVDSSGRLVATGDTTGGPLYPFGFGQYGRVCVVDASGRLVLSPLSKGLGEDPTILQRSSTGGSLPINLSNGTRFRVDLTEDATIAFTNPTGGTKYTFIFKQGLGGNDITWPGTVKWPGGTTPTLTAPSGSIDIVTMMYDNIEGAYYASAVQDFS